MRIYHPSTIAAVLQLQLVVHQQHLPYLLLFHKILPQLSQLLMELQDILGSEIEPEEYLVLEYLLGVLLTMNLSLRFPQLIFGQLEDDRSRPRRSSRFPPLFVHLGCSVDCISSVSVHRTIWIVLIHMKGSTNLFFIFHKRFYVILK